MKLNLWDTVLVSACYRNTPEYVERTCRVLRYCQGLVNFGKVILFTHLPPPAWFNGERVQMPEVLPPQCNLLTALFAFTLKPFDHVLAVSEDGFILDTLLWDGQFQEYDFIGAPWADGVVGNNGFAMYSSRFWNGFGTLPFQEPACIRPADEWFCRYQRAKMEEIGVKFAPTAMAEKFSTELTGRDKPSFGFHGKSLQPEKYAQGWKLIEALETSAPSNGCGNP